MVCLDQELLTEPNLAIVGFVQSCTLDAFGISLILIKNFWRFNFYCMIFVIMGQVVLNFTFSPKLLDSLTGSKTCLL